MMDDHPYSRSPNGKEVLTAFALYLGGQMLVLPVLLGVVLGLLHKHSLAIEMQPWFTVSFMIITAFICLIYSLFLQKTRQRAIWEQLPASATKRRRAFLTGCAAIVIALPSVFIVQVVVTWFMSFFVNADTVDQVAVAHLKDTLQEPWLFVSMLFAMVCAVPMLEELLFRGFLQNWMTRYWSVPTSILMTSFIFALFHLSWTQGWTNLPIFSAIFVLSILLGTLYQRFGSLWASMGLHCAFNALNAFSIAGNG